MPRYCKNDYPGQLKKLINVFGQELLGARSASVSSAPFIVLRSEGLKLALDSSAQKGVLDINCAQCSQ